MTAEPRRAAAETARYLWILTVRSDTGGMVSMSKAVTPAPGTTRTDIHKAALDDAARHLGVVPSRLAVLFFSLDRDDLDTGSDW